VKSVHDLLADYLVMGMSAVTFYRGAKGADAFQARVEKTAGVSISIGSHSCTAALKTYGGVKRIAILSPYYPVANEQVAKYFTDSGFEVVRDIYLQCKSWTAIAEVPPDLLREKLIELNGNGRDVDAIVQVGTNLSMVRLAAAAEMWLGKPVIAINTATYWHALRQNRSWTRSRAWAGCWKSFEAGDCVCRGARDGARKILIVDTGRCAS
jgi:maleate isomerase